MTIDIKFFGNFTIEKDGKEIESKIMKSKKSTAFLQYLIMKRDAVTNQNLMEALWPDNKNNNPESAIRTLVHRTRRMLSDAGVPEIANAIKTSRGYYRWEPAEDSCNVDIFQFEVYCAELQSTGITEEREYALLGQILDIYHGQLLEYALDDMWAVTKRVYYHNQYISAVLRYVELKRLAKDYDSAIEICRRAIDVDPFEEKLQIELIKALITVGKKRDALLQYYFARNIQYSELGNQLSEEMSDIYKNVIQMDQDESMDMDEIVKSFSAEDEELGAFVCSYEIFQRTYQLHNRIVDRYDNPETFCMITVNGPGNRPIEKPTIDTIMRQLQINLIETLRKSDVVARCSVNQYAILLISADVESGRVVLNRIREKFNHKISKSIAVLKFDLNALGEE